MTLLLAVLAASLLGSVHCAAMCGGFACLYADRPADHARAQRSVAFEPIAAYNVGRLVSYLMLGVVAGSIGGGVDQLGGLVRVSRLAAVVSGALLAVWGANTLLLASGFRGAVPGAPRIVQTAIGGLLVRLRHQRPTVRGAATGLLTTLLPCGWLYAFVATAGGTGRVRDSVLVMLFFWLGTLPLMASIGAGAQRAFGTFQRRLPLVAAGVAVVIGVLTMAGRLTVRPMEQSRHEADVTGVTHGG